MSYSFAVWNSINQFDTAPDKCFHGYHPMTCSSCDIVYDVLKNHGPTKHFFHGSNQCIICNEVVECTNHEYEWNDFKCRYCQAPKPLCPDYEHDFSNGACKTCGIDSNNSPSCEITQHQYVINQCKKCGYERILVPINIDLPVDILAIILLNHPSLYFAAGTVSSSLNIRTRDYLYQKFLVRPFDRIWPQDVSGVTRFDHVISMEQGYENGCSYYSGSCRCIFARTNSGGATSINYSFESKENNPPIFKDDSREGWTDFYNSKQWGDFMLSSYEYDLITSYDLILGRMKEMGRVDISLAKTLIMKTFEKAKSRRNGARNSYFVLWCMTNASMMKIPFNLKEINTKKFLDEIDTITCPAIEEYIQKFKPGDLACSIVIPDFFIKETVITVKK